MKLPYIPRPCDQCPFRCDTIPGWIGAERMREILSQGSFVCHKTAYGEDEDRRQCAGHMILKGHANDFVQLAERMEIPVKLSGQDLVFPTEDEAIKYHSRE